MINYKHARCPVCNEQFGGQDDIVVCPDCGTPYHRSCYQKEGHCIQTELHERGESWSMEEELQVEAQKLDGALPRRCPRCGTVNPTDRVFCQVCGTKLDETPQNAPFYHNPESPNPTPIPPSPFFNPFGGIPADEKIGGQSVRDLTLYVGQSSYYFLPRFKMLEQGHRGLGWNWPALLFHFLYFFYRKLYRQGFLLLGLMLLLSLPSMVLSREYAQQLVDAMLAGRMFTFQTGGLETYVTLNYICQLITWGVRLYFATNFNRFYYNHTIEQVGKLAEQYPDHTADEYAIALAKKGRVNLKLIIVLVSIFAVLYAAGYAILAGSGMF